MIGQKEAVVKLVKHFLPTFVSFKDVALVMLTKNELENVKAYIAVDIINGDIEYSKDRTKENEVITYARSMVMNHLKKAKELNGNVVYGKTSAQIKEVIEAKAMSNIDLSLLPQDLAEFVKTLV